jgi:hypothetical protein
MGLDMYLSKKHYVQKWNHQPKNEQFDVAVKKGDDDYNFINPEKVKYIEEEIGYWRKANHIHKWFVENVQDGIDECQESHVGIGDLKSLLCLCKEVLENRDKASSLLPTQSGFFFGDTQYDEYYFGDVEHTVRILESILNDVSEDGYLPYEVYYSSSW